LIEFLFAGVDDENCFEGRGYYSECKNTHSLTHYLGFDSTFIEASNLSPSPRDFRLGFFFISVVTI
jgi:hypothetical protein